MKPAELCDNKVGICRRFELNGDVGFQPRDVRLLHRAAKIDRDLPIGFLEIDQPRKNPEIARSLGHGDAYGPRRIARRLGCAPQDVESVTLHFRHIRHHRGAIFGERQASFDRVEATCSRCALRAGRSCASVSCSSDRALQQRFGSFCIAHKRETISDRPRTHPELRQFGAASPQHPGAIVAAYVISLPAMVPAHSPGGTIDARSA